LLGHWVPDQTYRGTVVATSEIFPEVDLAAIARYVAMPDPHAALRAFRDELRAR